jgi:hypothetical protein
VEVWLAAVAEVAEVQDLVVGQGADGTLGAGSSGRTSPVRDS